MTGVQTCALPILSNQINQTAEDLNEDLVARQIILGALQLASALA